MEQGWVKGTSNSGHAHVNRMEHPHTTQQKKTTRTLQITATRVIRAPQRNLITDGFKYLHIVGCYFIEYPGVPRLPDPPVDQNHHRIKVVTVVL
jgi:hypothetical protein